MQTIQLQRDRVLLLGPSGCLSSERALLNIELDAQGAGGLGARVNMALEGVNKLMSVTSLHALGDMGRWLLVGHLLTF